MAGQARLLIFVFVHESNQPIQDRGGFRLDVALVEIKKHVIQYNRPLHFRRGLVAAAAAVAVAEPALVFPAEAAVVAAVAEVAVAVAVALDPQSIK